MTIVTTYSTLITAILEETDFAGLESYVPGFIRRAEALFNRRLYSLDTEVATTAALTSVTTTASLPTGYKGMISIRIGDYVPLTQLSPEDFQAKWHEATAAVPQNWTIIDETIHFGPDPDTSYTANILYLSTLMALSADNASNWILAQHPDLYFDATLAYAYRHMRDSQGYIEALANAEKIIAEVNAYDARKRRGNSVETVRAEYF